jgi:cell division protease FtsH
MKSVSLFLLTIGSISGLLFFPVNRLSHKTSSISTKRTYSNKDNEREDNRTKNYNYPKYFQNLINDSTKHNSEKKRVFLEETYNDYEDNDLDDYSKLILGIPYNRSETKMAKKPKAPEKKKPPHKMTGGIQIIFQPPSDGNGFYEDDDDEDRPYMFQNMRNQRMAGNRGGKGKRKSENFEVLTKFPLRFTDIGGYDNIKTELWQCVDILKNYTKYLSYNVRIPKGLILEGPPGNGKTLLAKGFAGECQVGFIAVSGSEFQDKYVGVGSSRVRELFELANQNVPCIVFIDEIDALGRSRSKESDGEGASAERDNTLNELLVALDGFKNNTGVFLIGATNRADLLDPALIRPGRIDKRIFIGLPDEKTRRAIIDIHIRGKPYDGSVEMENLIDLTSGLSGAQIENLLNEAMLNALRYDRQRFSNEDIETVMNKMLVGWQPNEHEFTDRLIHQICVHEMGHAMVGLFAKNHAKVRKVVINLSSPTSPGYTIFENSKTSIYTREGLFEHLAILLSGRIAEELFFGVGSVTNGALNDFEEALKLAHKMVVYYGMGKQMIYPSLSDKYKEMIDADVVELIHSASDFATSILMDHRDALAKGAEILEREKVLKAEDLAGLL